MHRSIGVSIQASIRRAIVGGLLCASAGAQAAHIQTLGISEACVAMGGACAATSDDLGAYYSNPAGAVQFERPFIGGNFRLLDTRPLELRDSDGYHDIPRTNTKGNQALAPTVAAYLPTSDALVFGIALGAPFALSGNWTNEDGVHRYSMTDQALFLLDLSPNVAYRVNDRFSIGIAANITALKHLRTETLIPNTFLLGLPTELAGLGTPVAPTPTSPVVGSVTLETDGDVRLGIPPDRFASGFKEGTFTVGMQFRISDAWKAGATYRHLTRTQWTGHATFALPALQGPEPQRTRFKAAIDMPGHVQGGLAFQPFPALLWTADVQRTFWSKARGLGTPVEIRFDDPLLGLVQQLRVDYGAQDANTYHTGIRYRLSPVFSIMAGYAFDEHTFPDSKIDILTYDTDRDLFSLGVAADLRRESGRGWVIVGSFQDASYRRRKIRAGESANLGGVSGPNLDLSTGTLGFVPNTEDFRYGGDIYALSTSVSYEF